MKKKEQGFHYGIDNDLLNSKLAEDRPLGPTGLEVVSPGCWLQPTMRDADRGTEQSRRFGVSILPASLPGLRTKRERLQFVRPLRREEASSTHANLYQRDKDIFHELNGKRIMIAKTTLSLIQYPLQI